MLASTASPSAPPIMKAVFTMPEAAPAWEGSASPIATSSMGLNAMPAPMPSSSIPGSTSGVNAPSTGMRANSASPAAEHARPAASGPRVPKRITTRADSPSENAAMMRLAGRNARPTSSGV